MKHLADQLDYLYWTLCIVVMAALLARTAGGAPIQGWQPWINLTGYSLSYTYVPLSDNHSVKPEYANLLSSVAPRGFRFMDWNQTVASSLTNFSDRPLSDFGPAGASYEADFKLTDQFHAVPWLNMPDLSTVDYAKQLGTFSAQHLDPSIKELRIELGNEYWAGGDGYQGTANLLRARANPALAQYSDTEKMARNVVIEGAPKIDAFRAAFNAIRPDAKVVWEWGGFAPNQYWTQWGMDQLQKMGRDPSKMNIRAAVANYIEGSPTDIAIAPTDSYAAGLIKMKAFVDVNAQWDAANKGMASYYGLGGVDVYEFRAGTSGGITQGAMLDWWLGFNKSPEARELQQYALSKVVGVLGTDAAINLEGLYGIPYSQYGQFSLLDIDQLTTGSPSFSGVQDMIDYQSVPAPASLALVATLAAFSMAGRRERRAA